MQTLTPLSTKPIARPILQMQPPTPTQIQMPMLTPIALDNESNGSSREESQQSLVNKKDIINVNRQWNDANEELIVSIGENAASYKWMHEKCFILYSHRNQIVSFTLVLFGVLLSAESLIPTTEEQALDILRRVFTYFITIGNVIQSFLKYQELSVIHRSMAGKYSDLYNDIRQMMTMYRKTRPLANEYINEIIKRYDSLLIEAPEIQKGVVKRYKKIVSDDISQPTLADRIQKIKIISEKPIGNVFKRLHPKGKDSKIPNQTVQSNNLFVLSELTKQRDDITDLEANLGPPHQPQISTAIQTDD